MPRGKKGYGSNVQKKSIRGGSKSSSKSAQDQKKSIRGGTSRGSKRKK